MDFIYKAIGAVMKFFNDITGSYILALLLFAIAVRILFIPLDIKQQKNSIKQMKLRPKEMAIRNKYKGRNDRATQMKVQQEIQDLYQKEGYSVMGGCLPLLIQLPIIIILYKVIRCPLTYICGQDMDVVGKMADILNEFGDDIKSALNLATVKFTSADQIPIISAVRKMGEHSDILADFTSKMNGAFDYDSFIGILPKFDALGIDLSMTPKEAGKFFHPLMLVPVLNFVVQFVSTKLMRKFQPQPVGQDEQSMTSMKIMDIAMPALTLFIAYTMNAAIGVYWIFQNVVSLAERFVIARLMPLPSYTEEELKELEKAAKAAQQKREGAGERTERQNGEKPRSLHRIDEDDDDDVPPPVKKKASSESAQSGNTDKRKKDESKDTADGTDVAKRLLGEAPMLKDESDKKKKD